MSRHAQSLGYDAVILFLDELVLWLASHAADVEFVSREGTKLVKLVEATNADRPIPLVSFVARQRDLRELVGENLAGAMQLQFSDALKYWEARFHSIKLEDRNLPAIAEKRILRPRDEAARQTRQSSFESVLRAPTNVIEILLTQESDRELFRRVYATYLSYVDKVQAKSLAQNQYDQLRTRLRTQLDVAYGIAPEPRDAVDPQLSAEEQLRSLDPTFAPRPPVGADFKGAFEALLGQLFAHQFPAHPDFETEIKPATIPRIWPEVQAAVDEPGHRSYVNDQPLRRLIRSVVNPCRLGQMGETHLLLDPHWISHFGRSHAADGGGAITVAKLRQWIARLGGPGHVPAAASRLRGGCPQPSGSPTGRAAPCAAAGRRRHEHGDLPRVVQQAAATWLGRVGTRHTARSHRADSSGHALSPASAHSGGKTEAAIIPVLSRMLTEEWRGTSVLYVCPIKALLNNLEERLSRYAAFFGRTVQVWHGDIGASRKKRALADPPDILLTTPESIEGMLISPRIERTGWFGQLRTVIVDELHAFAGDDRGWHLRALLLRLSSYADQPLQRLGLSATVRNPQSLLEWFAPEGDRQVVGSAGVPGVNYLERSCCLTEECYQRDVVVLFGNLMLAYRRLWACGRRVRRWATRSVVHGCARCAAGASSICP